MRIFCLLLGLLISGNSFAATGSGNISTVKSFGGFGTALPSITVASTDTTYFGLTAGTVAANNNTFWNFYKDGGTAVYRVTQGKTCECDSFIFSIGGAAGGFQLVTSMTAWARADTSLTTGFYQAGAAGAPAITATAANTVYSFYAAYNFASNSYPGIQIVNVSNGLAHNVMAHCREY